MIDGFWGVDFDTTKKSAQIEIAGSTLFLHLSDNVVKALLFVQKESLRKAYRIHTMGDVIFFLTIIYSYGGPSHVNICNDSVKGHFAQMENSMSLWK